MKKKTTLSLLLLISCLSLFSQYTYYRNDSIVFKDTDNIPYKSPTVGGFNAPQFNQVDLNFDGFMDLVVFDRSGKRVSTFLNDGIADSISYTYAPEYQKLIPSADNFIISRDYNCNGKMDFFIGKEGIIVYENTSSNNILQFTEVTKLKSNYRPAEQSIQPAPADMPGIADIDGDGDLDIIEPYFIGGQQLNYHKNVSMENDGVCGLKFEWKSKCWGSFTESNFNSTVYLDSCRWDDFPDAELENKPSDVYPQNHHRNFNKHGNAGIALYDLDGNGSMDLLLGDDGSPRMTALFNDDSIAPHKNAHMHKYDSLYPLYDKSIDLRLFPTAYFMDVNNDSIDDLIAATNIIDVMSLSYTRKNIHLYLGTGNKQKPFTYKTNTFLDEDIIDFGRGSFPAFFDYDGDGLKDLVVGNEGYLDSTPNTNRLIGQLALFKNTGTPTRAEFTLVDENFTNIPSLKLDNNYLAATRLVPTFYDLTGDGKQDMIVGDVKGKVHFFKDTAAINEPAAFKLIERNMQGINVYNNATPVLFDVNGDGLADLILASKSPRLQLSLNLGDSTTPIFNLSVESIIWQSGNTVRYQLRGNPNLNLLSVGQIVDVNQSINADNGVLQAITAINNTQKYIDMHHPFRTNNNDDETNSTAVIDYSIKDFGQIDLGTNTHPVPSIYKNGNDLYMILGTFNGKFYLYDSISNNLKGKFRLRSSDYLEGNFGSHTAVAATDLNGNGKIDLAIGNEAGGINLMYARNGLGLDKLLAKKQTTHSYFKVYPNPTAAAFTIILKQFVPNSTVQIFNLSGKMVYVNSMLEQKITINQKLNSGLYFIKVSNNKYSSTEKLIVH